MSTDKLPEIIRNNTRASVIIHDLKLNPQDQGLHVTPPEAGKAPKLYYIKDMFGEKTVRASQGLRHALESNLVVGVAASEVDGLLKTVVEENLTDRLNKAVGKTPEKRKPGDQKAKGITDPVLRAEAQEAVSRPNEFDEALAAKREELKNDVLN